MCSETKKITMSQAAAAVPSRLQRLARLAVFAAGASVAIAGTALASDAGVDGGAPQASKIKPSKMTCQDFLALDDVSQPKVVYWTEGFNQKGKPDDVMFDTEATDRLVPVLIEVCKKEPTASFWKKTKAEFKKIF